jgi:hypothetical protein
MRPSRRIVTAAALAAAGSLAGAAPAAAATGTHLPLVTAGILGSIFGTIGHAVLGAFSWTIGLASKFILTTIGALVRMLIPRSWANEGVQIMEWIVAIPNYAGTVTSPAGNTIYGFAGINGLRDLFTWIGVGLLPLTLVYGTTRAMLGERGHVAVPIGRVVAIAALLVSYPYWWTEAAAMTDTVTHMVLNLPAVVTGLHQLMLYAVDGVALGGWQLVDLALMALVAIELLSLIFLKVVLILLGALLYATGPITIGLVATDSGAAIARAWTSAVALLVAVPVVWATLFAVGALLVGDAGTAGPLIAGNSSVGSLFGGVLLAVAGAASLWICLRAAREAMGLLRMQLGGLLALSHRGSGGSVRTPAPQSTASSSLRRFGARVAQATNGVGGELAAAGAGGAAVVRSGRAVGYVARHGALGTAAAGGRAAARSAGSHASGLVGRSRAGAVAVQMAKAGTAGWYATPAGKAAASEPTLKRATRQQGERAQASPRSDRGAAAPAASGSGASAPSAVRDAGGSQPSAGHARPAAQRAAAPSATRPGAPTPRPADKRPPQPATLPEPTNRTVTPPPPPPPPPRTENRPGRGKR